MHRYVLPFLSLIVDFLPLSAIFANILPFKQDNPQGWPTLSTPYPQTVDNCSWQKLRFSPKLPLFVRFLSTFTGALLITLWISLMLNGENCPFLGITLGISG